MKKIIRFSIGLIVVLFIAHKVTTSFSTDYRDEIRIGAEPLLNDHAAGLWPDQLPLSAKKIRTNI